MKKTSQWSLVATRSFHTGKSVLAEVRNWIVDQCPVGLSEVETIDLKVITSEIVQNIYRHGYQGLENQPFGVKFYQLDDTLKLVFEDSTPVPLSPIQGRENIAELRPGGRGVKIVQVIAEQYSYNRTDNGAEQIVIFKVEG